MKDFNYYLKQTGEYGEVVELTPVLVSVVGLAHARPFEIVVFESGTVGQIFSIGQKRIEIVIFSKTPLVVGERVARTNEILSIEVGDYLLGTVISPLGEGIFTPLKKGGGSESRPLENAPLGITSRASIKTPLYSGVTLVDLMLPLGKGQKQLVIGDRKTGKTSFLLTTVKNQVHQGSLVVYAAIARKQSDIQKLLEFFKKEDLEKNIVTVLTTSYDSPALIYLTPFAAMTIGEYFRDQGHDVLVVFDDLSSHAKFYREMSLVGRRFPGRESYPGDIFYTHSRLMERAGNFKIVNQVEQYNGDSSQLNSKEKPINSGTITDQRLNQSTETKEVSISCLPVVETVESDLTSYIATNIMSMTDGHIFFDQGTFAQGRRPAINIPLSVTRVGRQAQSALKRDINQKLTAFLSQFDQMQNLSHFGAELSGKVQNVLKTGEKLFSLLKQSNHSTIPEEAQLTLFGLIWSNAIEEKDIAKAREAMISVCKDAKKSALLKAIIAAETLDQFLVQINQHQSELLSMLNLSGVAVTPTPTTTPTSEATNPQQTASPPSGETQQPTENTSQKSEKNKSM